MNIGYRVPLSYPLIHVHDVIRKDAAFEKLYYLIFFPIDESIPKTRYDAFWINGIDNDEVR